MYKFTRKKWFIHFYIKKDLRTETPLQKEDQKVYWSLNRNLLGTLGQETGAQRNRQ